ncbi:MAG: NADH-quinone oxidoreductase subunit J [Myxococcales bacterium]|nr:NADH-quinone oxidoreductase subunit J [Myxococcales bacterium]MCB9645086.1 NADH-quinone oxidoreductase subunit J [Deltaproteobacteria bacterium]
MNLQTVLFAVFALGSVISALGVVVIRNPVKGAMSLIGCFFSLACLFLLEAAELVAILEVLVYAGAIMVLFTFVIMLVENKSAAIVRNTVGQRLALPVKLAGVAVVAYGLVAFVRKMTFGAAKELPADFGSVAAIGHEFFDNFVFHFEMTSVLLLVGIVGAVIVSKKRRGQP